MGKVWEVLEEAGEVWEKIFGNFWRMFGRTLGRFWRRSGRFWKRLGRFWGRFWRRFGTFWRLESFWRFGKFWGGLNRFWRRFWEAPGEVLEGSGEGRRGSEVWEGSVSLAAFGEVWGGFGEGFGEGLEKIWEVWEKAGEVLGIWEVLEEVWVLELLGIVNSGSTFGICWNLLAGAAPHGVPVPALLSFPWAGMDSG